MNQVHIKFTTILTVVKIFSQNMGSISAAASAASTAGRQPAAMALMAPSCVCVTKRHGCVVGLGVTCKHVCPLSIYLDRYI